MRKVKRWFSGLSRLSRSGLEKWHERSSSPRRLKDIAVLVATILGGVGGLVAALQFIWPTVTEGSAELSNLEVGPNVTYGEYLQRPGVSASEVTVADDESLKRAGTIIYFHAQMNGSPKEVYPVKWSVLDANTKLPEDPGLDRQPAWPTPAIQPQQRQKSQADYETWVPFPSWDTKGLFLVRLDIYQKTKEGDEQPLDHKEVSIGTQEK